MKPYKARKIIVTDHLKGVEATCVEIATEMRKCFRLKDMLNFNVLRKF